jgi:formin-binding protein 1
LEKDYSSKLLALTKKAQAKKAKRMLGVVLGGDPAKTYTDDTIRSSTLYAAYLQFLTSWEESATLHSIYAQELGNGIVEELRKLEKKKEETNRIVSVNLRSDARY